VGLHYALNASANGSGQVEGPLLEDFLMYVDREAHRLERNCLYKPWTEADPSLITFVAHQPSLRLRVRPNHVVHSKHSNPVMKLKEIRLVVRRQLDDDGMTVSWAV
jgi:hypothetical protein